MFTVTESSGSYPLSYKWLKNGSPVIGGTNNIYFANEEGTYSCVVSNCVSAGVTSESSTLILNSPPSGGSISPSGMSNICTGGSQTFTMSDVTGTTPLSYQWFIDATPVSGISTNNTFIATQPGKYICNVSNVCNPAGQMNGPSFIQEITPPAIGSLTPTGTTTICNGSTQVF